jgi:hypothetical protein
MRPDLLAHQFGVEALLGHVRIAPADRGPTFGDKRHREKMVELQQAGAEAVVDVVIIVRDIVGNGCHLRLEAGPGHQIRRELTIGLGERPSRVRHRAVMLGEALQRLPAEIEAGCGADRALQPRQQPQRMRIVIKAARLPHRLLKRLLAGMAEGRVADIMREAKRLGEILVEAEHASDGAADLRHFDAVGQADAEMVPVGGDEDLRLVAEAAERNGMDDAIAIALESVAGAAHLAAARRMDASARTGRIAGIGG